MDTQQLAIFEETEFILENWRSEGQGDAEELSALKANDRGNDKRLAKLQWKIGDWLLRGKENLVSDLDLELEVARIYKKMDRTTIWDYIRVAKAFKDNSRRRESLSWSHHKEVAIEKFIPAKRDELLADAESRNLSVKRLRDLAKRQEKAIHKGQAKDPLGKHKTKTVKITLLPDDLKFLRKLGFARRCDPSEILYDIVRNHFRDNRESLTKEVNDWETAIAAKKPVKRGKQ